MKTWISVVQTICIIALLGCCILNQITINNWKETYHTLSVAYKDMEKTKDIYETLYNNLYESYWNHLTGKSSKIEKKGL